MGTWGSGSFENDDASDFAIEFESDGMQALELAFGIAGHDYLEAPDAQRAVAAAEILALSKSGGISDDLAIAPELYEAVERHASEIRPRFAALRRKALAALDRVAGDRSELKQLWEEDDASEWLSAMRDLRERLAGN